MPEVAIGLPTYNRPDFLEAALRSLTTQTFGDFELLISDNASTHPDIRTIAERYATADPRIRYVRQKTNLGPVGNFAHLFANSTAPLFMWAADDDLWEPAFVERAVAALRADPTKAAWFCQLDNIDAEGDVTRTYPPLTRLRSNGDKRREVRRFLMEPDRHGKVNLIYGMFRREAMAEPMRLMIANREMIGADLVFVYAFICRADVAIDPDVLFHKRVVDRKGQRPRPPSGAGLLKSRHFAGFAAAAAGTPYAAMTRSLLPWRFVLDRVDKIGNGVRRSLFARTQA